MNDQYTHETVLEACLLAEQLVEHAGKSASTAAVRILAVLYAAVGTLLSVSPEGDEEAMAQQFTDAFKIRVQQGAADHAIQQLRRHAGARSSAQRH